MTYHMIQMMKSLGVWDSLRILCGLSDVVKFKKLCICLFIAEVSTSEGEESGGEDSKSAVENVVTKKLSLLFVKLLEQKKKLKNIWVFMVLIMTKGWLDNMKLSHLINSVMEKVTEEHLLESLLQLSTVVGKVDLKIEELLPMLTLMLFPLL